MEILERFADGVIALVELDKLHDHEQIKQEYLKTLTEEIKKDGQLKCPLIVDRYSYVVLDGHHRFHSLKSIGCKYAPAFVVDYYDPNIKLDMWIPVVKTRSEAKAAVKSLVNGGYSLEEVESEDELKLHIDAELACLGLILEESDKEQFFIVNKEKCNFETAVEIIKKGLEIEGLRKEFDHVAGESELKIVRKEKKVSLVVITPKVTKGKVVETGAAGNVFPAKTTRHVIPEKKVYPIPLADLMAK